MSAMLFSVMRLLAEGEAAPQQGDPSGGIFQLLLPFAAIFALFYFLIMRPEKRKQAQHQALLSGLKKNDRVVTIGGIYGVVANVQREADRVSIKIDEATNTKIDVTFNAIARVIAEETPEENK